MTTSLTCTSGSSLCMYGMMLNNLAGAVSCFAALLSCSSPAQRSAWPSLANARGVPL